MLQDHQTTDYSAKKEKPDVAAPRDDLTRLLTPVRDGPTWRPTSSDTFSEAIERMNEQFAVALIGGDARIMARADAGSGAAHRQIKPGAFHIAYQPWKYVNADGDLQSFSKAWMDSMRRKTFFNVTFDPSGAKMPPSTLNLWNGFGVEAKQGDWTLLRTHIYEVLCRSNPMFFAWLMCWLAQIIQEPHEKMGTAVVVRGLKGTGKSIVAEYVAKLMPGNSMAISRQNQLLGRFNDHLVAKLFILLEEAVWAGDKAAESVLKDLVTAHIQSIEGKGLSIIQVPDYSRLWLCTNAEWAVPATWDERRFFVLEASADYKEDAEYFGAIRDQMKNGGLEAMMYDLKTLYRAGWVNLRKPPKTPWLAEQVGRSFKSQEKWWHAVLTDGVIEGSHTKHYWPNDDEAAGGHTAADEAPQAFQGHMRSQSPPKMPKGLRVEIADVYASYRAWCTENKEKYPESKEDIGKFLADVADVKRDRPRVGNARPYVYDFESLERVRGYFSQQYGMEFDAGAYDDADLATWGIDEDKAEEMGLDRWEAYGEGEGAPLRH